MAAVRRLLGLLLTPPLIVQKLFGGGVAVVAVALLMYFGLLEALELGALDRFFRLRGPRTPVAPIVVVAVDEDSFDELNLAWPFPRALHGTLLEMIASGGPLAIGVDILFSEPSIRGAEDDVELGASV